MPTCRSCGASIIWAKTIAGKAMPVDAEPTAGGNLTMALGECRPASEASDAMGMPRHTSHFATCAFAAQHRRQR